jgi:hypothetical protein
MNKDPLHPGDDLHTIQLYGEGMVRAARPRIHPHGHLLSVELFDVATNKGPQEVPAC